MRASLVAPSEDTEPRTEDEGTPLAPSEGTEPRTEGEGIATCALTRLKLQKASAPPH